MWVSRFELMPRFGEEMQCPSYSTRDLNLGADGNIWSINNSDKSWKIGDDYNVLFSPCTPNQYLGHSMGVLKQTMLKHEATFRDQVVELHRLYGRQRELMDEIKRRELSKHHLQLKTSQCNPVLAQMPSELAQRTSHIPSFPWMNDARSRSSALSTENFQSPSDSSLTKSSLEDCKMMLSKSNKYGKRMLDLQLPADEYIDSEEGERIEEEKVSEVREVQCYPPKKISKNLSRRDTELFLSSAEFDSTYQGGSSRTDSFSRKTNDLVDLNEPIGLEEAATPIFLGSNNCCVEIPYRDQNLSGKPGSSSQILTKENFHNIQAAKDLETCSDVIHLEEEDDRREEFLCYNAEPGKKGSRLNHLLECFSPEILPKSSVELRAHCPTSNLLDKSIQKPSESKQLGLKISEIKHDLSNDDFTGLVSSCIPTARKLVHPQSNVAKSSVSSQRKSIRNLRHIPIAVQALPCLNTPVSLSKSSKSSVMNPVLDGNNDNGCTSEHHNLTKCFKGSDCMVVYSSKYVDLKCVPSSYSPDTTISTENGRTTHGEKKLEDSLGELCWLRANQAYQGKPVNEIEHITRVEPGLSQAFPTFICDVEPKRLENSHCPTALTSNFLPNTSEDKDIENREKVGSKNAIVVENGVDGKISSFGYHIDSNSESSLTSSIRSVVMKTAAERDLEAPVSPENKESYPPRGESEEYQLESSVQLPKKEDGDPQGELARIAAEAIVLISSSRVQPNLENATREPSESSSDCLHWFAGVVSSIADGLETCGVADGVQNEIDGIDYFEAMTLKLTDTMTEEYCYKSNDQKENSTKATLLARRGRTRRARQRKDFQMEVLPCLASLSRHEAKEDLQIIGGLMAAAGTPLETGLGRRNACRNVRARGRKCSSTSRFNMVARTIPASLKQQTHDSNLGFLEGCLTGWPKIYKRQRGQRFPVSNPSLMFSRV